MTHRPAQSVDLEASPSSVSAARRFVRQVLLGWDLDGLVDTVALLTSELATNAVLHARTGFAVLLEEQGDQVRVEVLDRSAVLPRRRSNSLSAATGRGVALVEELSSSWGTTPAPSLDGYAKGVWFTVPTAGVAENAWDGDWLEGL